MAEQSLDAAAAGARTRRLAAGRAAKTERVARAKRELAAATTRWRAADSEVLRLQRAGASPARIAAAKARLHQLAADCLAARAAVVDARAPRGDRR